MIRVYRYLVLDFDIVHCLQNRDSMANTDNAHLPQFLMPQSNKSLANDLIFCVSDQFIRLTTGLSLGYYHTQELITVLGQFQAVDEFGALTRRPPHDSISRRRLAQLYVVPESRRCRFCRGRV